MNKVIFEHPLLEDIELGEEHAKNLEELEKTQPSGWKRKKEVTKNADNANNGTTDKGGNKGVKGSSGNHS